MKLPQKLPTWRLAVPLLAVLTLPIAADESQDFSTRIGNATMELKVKAALLDKIGWDMLDVDVEASGADITLTGEAETKANGELAKEVALSVDGVQKVENRVTVTAQPAEGAVGRRVAEAELEVKDALLESRVKGALIAEVGRNAFELEVEASDGTVSLRGNLESAEHRTIALTTVRQLSGVDKVIDLMSVDG
ncbi:MAG: BON domain-containing protein [Acidobacteriota bacterium]